MDIQPLQTIIAIVIGGAAGKQAHTSEPISKGRAAKRAQAVEPAKTAAPSSIEKWKGVVELLSLALDNEFLNAAKVTPESTPASAAKKLYNKMFKRASDALDPRFLALVSNLAYPQWISASSMSWDENITTTGEPHGQTIELKGAIEDLTKQLREMKEEAAQAYHQAFAVES